MNSPGSTAPHACEQCSQPLTAAAAGEEFAICSQCGNQQSVLSTHITAPAAGRQPPAEQLTFSERFQLGEILGQGTFGVVFSAFDTELGRNVAIKAARHRELAAERAQLFIREARAISRLRHPQIVTIHDIVRHRGDILIVSDLIPGVTLRNWLESETVTFEKAAEVALSICRAIAYAHSHGVIHRDLKPGNIIVDPSGVPHILDFGLSQSLEQALETVCHEGSPIGTPAYMAPEQVRGARSEIDQRSDVYSIGIILFQMLTRRLPFSGPPQELFQQIQLRSAPRLDKAPYRVPAALAAICQRALEKSPANRYQSAEEMADDLQRFLSGRLVGALGRPDSRVIKHWTRRWFTTAAAVGLATVVGIGGYQWYQREQTLAPTWPIRIASDPPGAELSWHRLDPLRPGEAPYPVVEQIAGQPSRLAPGYYRVEARLNGELVEVYRTIPERLDQIPVLIFEFLGEQIRLNHRAFYVTEGVVELPPVRVTTLPTEHWEWVPLPPGKLTIPDAIDIPPALSGTDIEIPSLWMTRSEVSWGDLQAVWPKLQIPAGSSLDDSAIGVNWEIANALAEEQGARLPSVHELHWAATNGDTTQFPQGNTAPPWEAREPNSAVAAWDRTREPARIVGLWTGTAEWTSTPALEWVVVDGHKKLNSFPGSLFPDRWFQIQGGPQAQPSTPPSSLIQHTQTESTFLSGPTSFRLVRRVSH